jgi:hypothetical protein
VEANNSCQNWADRDSLSQKLSALRHEWNVWIETTSFLSNIHLFEVYLRLPEISSINPVEIVEEVEGAVDGIIVGSEGIVSDPKAETLQHSNSMMMDLDNTFTSPTSDFIQPTTLSQAEMMTWHESNVAMDRPIDSSHEEILDFNDPFLPTMSMPDFDVSSLWNVESSHFTQPY